VGFRMDYENRLQEIELDLIIRVKKIMLEGG
jgi:hypothetical protein